MLDHHKEAVVQLSADFSELSCSGDWTIAGISSLEYHLHAIEKTIAKNAVIDFSGVTAIDSAGALLLQSFLESLRANGKSTTLLGLTQQYQSVVQLVAEEANIFKQSLPLPIWPGFFYSVGEWATQKWNILIDFLAFMGEVIISLGLAICEPARMQWQLIMRTIDEMGYRGMPIVALLNFLVGVVLTYQIALQLATYNADIYIVDITGMVILREFGPLITAIIAAGRTSTAFTAQIGTMKVSQEIDALYTMGVPPIERLVNPKIVALLIALPLLTVWADLFGILGSMLMSKYQLGIAYYTYLERFQHAIAVKHYVVGLVKAPVFALIVAMVGCFQGFQVSGTADSVGQKTTQSAVQSIFLIIIADAIFSIVFSWRGI